MSLTRLKHAIRVDHDDDDERLEVLRDAAREYLERRIGRYLDEPAGQVEHVRGRDKGTLWLRSPPVGEVQVDDVDSDRYRVVDRRLERTDGTPWFAILEYRISYTAGYEEDAGPAPLLAATEQLVRAWYEDPALLGTATGALHRALRQLLEGYERTAV